MQLLYGEIQRWSGLVINFSSFTEYAWIVSVMLEYQNQFVFDWWSGELLDSQNLHGDNNCPPFSDISFTLDYRVGFLLMSFKLTWNNSQRHLFSRPVKLRYKTSFGVLKEITFGITYCQIAITLGSSVFLTTAHCHQDTAHSPNQIVFCPRRVKCSL